MKSSKKVVKMIILTIFILVFITACKKEDKILDPANPITITLWHYYSGNNYEAIEIAIDDFNQTIGLEEGIVVEPIRFPSIAELEESVENSAKGVVNSEPLPDIFSCYPDVAYKIDKLDKLLDLNEYFTKEELEAYVPSFLDVGYLEDGKLGLIPIVKSTELLYINDTEWEEFSQVSGYTDEDLETWESIAKISKEYYQWTDDLTPDTSWDGKAFLGYDSVANFIIIANRQMDVEIINRNEDGTGHVFLDREVMRKIFDIYYEPTCFGYFGSYGEFRADDVKQGDLVSYVASSSGASYFPTDVTNGNTLEPVEFKALKYPVLEGGKKFAVQQGAGMSIIKSEKAHELGASIFLKWFTSEEENFKFAMETGYLPANNNTYSSDAVREQIETLHQGDASEKIIGKVYEVAFDQIINADTYSAKPFENSYNVRQLNERKLMELAEDGMKIVQSMREDGEREEDIRKAIKPDEAFNQWIENIQSELEYLELEYVVE